MLTLSITICSYASFMYGGDWGEDKCEICGKSVGIYYEDSFMFGGGGTYSPRPICIDYKPAKHINHSIIVCPECYTKYNKEISNLIDTWIKQKQIEYKDIHKQYNTERLQRKQKRLQEEINKLEDELNNAKQMPILQ